MKASDRFCYGCKEFLCSTKFGLVKSHREELCIECEAELKRVRKENALAKRQAEFKENQSAQKVPKSATGSNISKRLKTALDKHEELRILKQMKEGCGL